MCIRDSDHRVDLIGLAYVGGHEQPTVRKVFRLVPATDRYVRARIGKALSDASPDAPTAAGDEHDAVVEAREVGRIVHGGGVYDLTPRQIDRTRAAFPDQKQNRGASRRNSTSEPGV